MSKENKYKVGMLLIGNFDYGIIINITLAHNIGITQKQVYLYVIYWIKVKRIATEYEFSLNYFLDKNNKIGYNISTR